MLPSSPQSNGINEEQQVFNLYIAGNYIGDNARIDGNISSQGLKKRDYDPLIEVTFADESLISVSQEEVEKLKSVYVENHIYGVAKSAFKKSNLLVISGSASIGKSSSAIHLISSESDDIYWLSLNVELVKFDFREGCGYILQGDAYDDKLSNVLRSRSALDLISKLLRSKSSYLIITLESSSHYSVSDESMSYSFQWGNSLTSQHILQKHLCWYCKEVKNVDENIDVLQSEDIQGVLSQKLSFRDIDNLAKRLTKVLEKKSTLNPDHLGTWSFGGR
jgi:hypothetical protein